MFKFESRPEASRIMSIASPLLALAITVVIGTVLFVLLGKDPLRGLYVFFVEPVKSLSGGNLQKFIVGREIAAHPKLLIVSQPTWGVDVGAAAQIRGELLKLRDEGCALLVVSEELDELFEICDRLVVIAQGRVSPSVPTAQATIEMIGEWMSGLWTRDGAAGRAQRGEEVSHA